MKFDPTLPCADIEELDHRGVLRLLTVRPDRWSFVGATIQDPRTEKVYVVTKLRFIGHLPENALSVSIGTARFERDSIVGVMPIWLVEARSGLRGRWARFWNRPPTTVVADG